MHISIISHSVILRMRNILEKNCTENQNTHFIFNTFLKKSCRLRYNMEKHCRAGQATDDDMVRAHWGLDNLG